MKRKTFKLIKIISLKLYVSYLLLKLELARLAKKRVVFIFGTPLHQNIGDLAIARAETEFIKKYVPRTTIIKVPLVIMVREEAVIFGMVRDTDTIIGHGGGNMGDTYMVEEVCRRNFIQYFPNNNIIIFPQTIHFSDGDTGRNELAETVSIYSQHHNLALIAREEISYKKMQKIFKHNVVILTPDIVLSVNQSGSKNVRDGVLICMRNDVESKINTNDKQIIIASAEHYFKKITYTDTISKDKFFFVRSKDKIVQDKLDEFKSSKLVITDRLHGMVFAAITGTPCIAMANFNHKVKGTYEWINFLSYIKFCSEVSDIDNLINQMDLNKTYVYDSIPFNSYWNKIKDLII